MSVQENHVLSLLLHEVTWKLWENASKSLFLYYNSYNGALKHEGFVGFENFCSRAKTYAILTSLITFISMHVTVDNVNFCDGLEGVYVKYKSHASKARELPD